MFASNQVYFFRSVTKSRLSQGRELEASIREPCPRAIHRELDVSIVSVPIDHTKCSQEVINKILWYMLCYALRHCLNPPAQQMAKISGIRKNKLTTDRTLVVLCKSCCLLYLYWYKYRHLFHICWSINRSETVNFADNIYHRWSMVSLYRS